MSLLQLEGVSIAYDAEPVVRDLSLSLGRGAIGCLLGPSGCGKTTALRAVAGFERIARGEIRIEGRVVAGAGTHVVPEHRQVGMVFQEHALFPHLRVEDNVGFGLRHAPAATRAARVEELLATVGLGALARRWPHELSGGQRQRVALARALAPR